MGLEIERKFLVANDMWCADADQGAVCRQGYLAVGPPVAVRVRIMDGRACLNIKTATLDIVRDEFEYPIPIDDAIALLDNSCHGYIVEKTRYKVPCDGFVWEVDVFEGVNGGLVVAEIELDDADQAFAKPPWLGREVSLDPRYLNTSLSVHPYCDWRKQS